MKSNKHIMCCIAVLSLLLAECGKTEQAANSEKQVQDFVKTEQGYYLERTETTIQAVRGGVLHLVSKQGDVDIDSWNRDEVRVLVEKRSDVSDEAQALALFEAFQVTTTPVSDTVQVEAGVRGEGPLDSVMVKIFVSVPSQFGVYVKTAKGGIVIRDLKGDIEARTDFGGITFNSVMGDVKAETEVGGITLNGGDGLYEVKTGRGGITIQSMKGNIKAETGGGGIKVKGSSGPMVVKTNEGDIEISGALGYIEAASQSGNIEAELRIADEGVDTHCKLVTGSGDVTIYLPKKLAATIDAELRIEGQAHRDRTIYSDFPIDIREESESRIVGIGEINNGGDSIVLRTKNRDINIKKL
jgi:Toastrack DUF4097